MQWKLQEEILEEQASFSFRPQKETCDQIMNLRIVLEIAQEWKQPLYVCFIDFTEVFDMVQHDKLLFSMLYMGFTPHLAQLLRNLYKQQSAAVKVAGTLSEWFGVKKGVWQGCNVSSCLFSGMLTTECL